MDQSELSKIIAKLKIAYAYYFKELDEDLIVAMASLFYENLKDYEYERVNKAINNIIRKSKYMPSISDILEEIDKIDKIIEFDILKKMLEDGYFKYGAYGELDPVQQVRNYEKATMWLEKGIIPEWLLQDMMKYGYKQPLAYTEKKQLAGQLLLGE